MDLTRIPLMNAISTKLNWLSSKQRVIAQNIANASTPGYRARTLAPPDFSSLVSSGSKRSSSRSGVTLLKADNRHIDAGASSSSGSASHGFKNEEATAQDGTPGGNTVVLEEQMIEMANTQLEYATMINLYRRQISMLKLSLGRRS
jgi:flagellar basal-body rod protein FlgB